MEHLAAILKCTSKSGRITFISLGHVEIIVDISGILVILVSTYILLSLCCFIVKLVFEGFRPKI